MSTEAQVADRLLTAIAAVGRALDPACAQAVSEARDELNLRLENLTERVRQFRAAMGPRAFTRGDRVEGEPGLGTVVEPTNDAGNVGVYWDLGRLNTVEWPQASLLVLRRQG